MTNHSNFGTLSKRIAVFDIGTNSVKLLVADVGRGGEARVLLEKVRITRLGEGIRKDFRLNERAMKRTLDALAAFKRECMMLGVDQYRAVATSAMRQAANHREFARRFRVQMGFDVQVISGRREAELIFRGASSDPSLAGKCRRIVVMDSGGGSAEWILGIGGRVKRRLSLGLGCVRTTERFLRGDPYTEESFRQLMSFYRKRLAPLRKRFAIREGRLIATGGSITTAAAIRCALPSYDNKAVHGCLLSVRRLKDLMNRLRAMTQNQRTRLRNMEAQRADIIVAGVALFVVAMQTLGSNRLYVSTRALHYGALLSG